MPAVVLRLLVAFVAVLLSLWLALAVAGGVAAAAVFPAAKSLPISLAGFDAFAAARPEEARVLAAGHLVERVFELTGTFRCVLGALAVLLAVASALAAPRLERVRALPIAAGLAGLALASALVGNFIVQPDFQNWDRQYRNAAGAGDLVAADTLKREVDRGHLAASRTATLEVGALLLAIGALAFGAAAAAGLPSPAADPNRDASDADHGDRRHA